MMTMRMRRTRARDNKSKDDVDNTTIKRRQVREMRRRDTYMDYVIL